MSLALEHIDPPLRLRTEIPMDDDAFLAFCAANEPNRFERDSNGEIIVMSPAGLGGAATETDVIVELATWARVDGRGKAFSSNSGVRLPDTSIRAADAAWIGWEKLNARTEMEKKGFSPLCPEFVIEVRSENDRLKPLHARLGMWLSNGVELAWLIDPERRVVETYLPRESPEVHQNPISVQGSGGVRGFELIMNSVWD